MIPKQYYCCVPNVEKRYLLVTMVGQVVTSIRFTTQVDSIEPLEGQVKEELQEYFVGDRNSFTFAFDQNGTDFQKKVWNGLLTIPYGTTMTYQAFAKSLGMLNAARAVGNAVAKNNLLIVLPCHRLVHTHARQMRYRDGAEMKTILLKLEKGIK